ncbi:unnamed protein product [Brassicogethes aeneus]|uniref:Uncharacterized protein n=1 Tax=Brassicogethes aeneus TaxID=1431903 RepID=A0A9P0ASV2_BRAAE|nr:unnamed protein product [Brassicogethes aeneus]
MLKLIAFFAILAAAFAAPKPDPLTLTYSAGIPLAYSGIGSPISYSNLGYQYGGYTPYASGYYNYYNGLAYRDLYL